MLKTFLQVGAASTLAIAAMTTAQTTTPTTNTTTPPVEEPGAATVEATPEQEVQASIATATEDGAATTPSPATTPNTTTTATTSADATATTTVAPAEGTIAAAVGANAQLSTLGAALTSAELTATLAGPGPFTVFAPTNDAFALISPETRAQLMDPANKASLQTVLKHHVVAGSITAAQLRERITAGGGTATLETVAGQTLRASLEGENIVLMGENNSKAYISTPDVAQSNGTVHVVNGILVPRLG